jgi:hypothetical protein
MLVARPCDRNGNYLPPGAPPPPPDVPADWAPFNNRPSFEIGRLLYEKMQTSKGDIDTLMNLWKAQCILTGGGEAPFEDTMDLYDQIDAIAVGDANWDSFSVRYTGPVNENSPSWMRDDYVVHMRDPRVVVANQVGSVDFNGKFDYVAFEEYTAPGQRRWSHIMSGHWAKKKSVSDTVYIAT